MYIHGVNVNIQGFSFSSILLWKFLQVSFISLRNNFVQFINEWLFIGCFIWGFRVTSLFLNDRKFYYLVRKDRLRFYYRMYLCCASRYGISITYRFNWCLLSLSFISYFNSLSTLLSLHLFSFSLR